MSDPVELGPYQIEEEIGAGGMGHVFRALHVPLNRHVALKVMRSSDTADVDRQRFLQEIKILAGLAHTNVVRVLDAGEQDGVDYLAMELLSGDSLSRRLKIERRLAWRDAAELGGALADGLAFLHERRVLHRDLKPSNIMFTREGEVKLIDFGLARVSDATRLTRTDKIVGTVGFVAPEVLSGDPATERSDLWSLGAVLYTALTGHLPIPVDDMATWLTRALNGNIVPPHQEQPEIPPPVSLLVLELLRPLPDGRPRSARAFAQALRKQVRRSRATQMISPPPAVGPDDPTTRLPLVRSGGSTPSGALEARRWLFGILGMSVGASLTALALIAWTGPRRGPPAIPSPPARQRASPASPRAPDAAPVRDFLALAESGEHPFGPVVAHILKLRPEKQRGRAVLAVPVGERRETARAARDLAEGFLAQHRISATALAAAIPEWFASPARDREERRRLYRALAQLGELDAAGELVSAEPVLDAHALARSYVAVERRGAPHAPGYHPCDALTDPLVRDVRRASHLPLVSHRLNIGGSIFGLFDQAYLDASEHLALPSADDPTHRRGLWSGFGDLPEAYAGRPLRVTIGVTNLTPEFRLWLRIGEGLVRLTSRVADFPGFVPLASLAPAAALEARAVWFTVDLPAAFLAPGERRLALRLECFSSRDGRVEEGPQMCVLDDLAVEAR